MKYGEALSHYLEKSGMSQAELAAAIGSPRSTVNALIKGLAKEPTLSTAKSISDALGVPLDEMASAASGEYGRGSGNGELREMTFAKTVETAMARCGMGPKGLADASGLGAAYISKLLNGRVKEPTWSKACALIDAMGMTANEFRDIQLGKEETR